MPIKLVYSPSYDIKFYGIENLHPFDSCKYSKAWKELEKKFSDKLSNYKIEPEREVSKDELRTVHTEDYLKSMEGSILNFSSLRIATALELPLLALVHPSILQSIILKPMKIATMGTILAAKEALQNNGFSINLSGGYHHASQDKGEGFCIYSDIAVAIQQLRCEERIKTTDTIAIIDLDAHQGNGLERIFYKDKTIKFFDMYNQEIYPNDEWARERIDFNIPLISGTKGQEYLRKLEQNLPQFLQKIEKPKIAFYNAGNDIFEDDPLGGLKVSDKDILERDKFVAKILTDFKIPWVMVLSGGYTRNSYKLIANSISWIIDNFGR